MSRLVRRRKRRWNRCACDRSSQANERGHEVGRFADVRQFVDDVIAQPIRILRRQIAQPPVLLVILGESGPTSLAKMDPPWVKGTLQDQGCRTTLSRWGPGGAERTRRAATGERSGARPPTAARHAVGDVFISSPWFSWLSSTRGSGNFRRSSRKCDSGG